MPIYAQTHEKTPFESPPPGAYAATIGRVWDVGLQRRPSMDGKADKIQHQCCVAFELDERDSKGRHFVLQECYTLSLHDKAILPTVILAAKPKLQRGELANVDLERLAGCGVMVTAGMSKSGKVKVKGVAPMPKGMKGPVLEREYGEPFGLAKYVIERALPASAIKPPAEQVPAVADGDGADEPDDADGGIPF